VQQLQKNQKFITFFILNNIESINFPLRWAGFTTIGGEGN
jgi:hypothetical protein